MWGWKWETHKAIKLKLNFFWSLWHGLLRAPGCCHVISCHRHGALWSPVWLISSEEESNWFHIFFSFANVGSYHVLMNSQHYIFSLPQSASSFLHLSILEKLPWTSCLVFHNRYGFLKAHVLKHIYTYTYICKMTYFLKSYCLSLTFITRDLEYNSRYPSMKIQFINELYLISKYHSKSEKLIFWMIKIIT